MRLVRQRDKDGCGIACVATLGGLPYRRARIELFRRTGPRNSSLTNTGDLRRALKKRGFRVSRRLKPLYRRQLIDLKANAILKVNPKPNGSWHWVIWDAKRRQILDPEGHRKRPYRYVSYLLVRDT